MGKLEVVDLEGIAGKGHWRVELDGELLATFPYSNKPTKVRAEHTAGVWLSGVEFGMSLVGSQF